LRMEGQPTPSKPSGKPKAIKAIKARRTIPSLGLRFNLGKIFIHYSLTKFCDDSRLWDFSKEKGYPSIKPFPGMIDCFPGEDLQHSLIPRIFQEFPAPFFQRLPNWELQMWRTVRRQLRQLARLFPL